MASDGTGHRDPIRPSTEPRSGRNLQRDLRPSGRERTHKRGTLPRMSEESELRATSDSMLQMLDHIRDLESRKRQEVVGTETFSRLAWEVNEAARMVQRWAELQLRQANEARADDGDSAAVPLVEVPARRLDVVLAEWRQAEIVLSQALPGSPEADRAAEDVARLRYEYGVLQERKLEEQRSR
jgi:hypothetical protein